MKTINEYCYNFNMPKHEQLIKPVHSEESTI
jgi:hypothetical protein